MSELAQTPSRRGLPTFASALLGAGITLVTFVAGFCGAILAAYVAGDPNSAGTAGDVAATVEHSAS